MKQSTVLVKQLLLLRIRIKSELDRIHSETFAKFRTYTRSNGQRTRLDRLK